MTHQDPYLSHYLVGATQEEIVDFQGIVEGRLPLGFDRGKAEDWIMAVHRIKAASDARREAADAEAERIETRTAREAETAALVVGGCGLPSMPRSSRSSELDLVRDWMGVASGVSASVFPGTPARPC